MDYTPCARRTDRARRSVLVEWSVEGADHPVACTRQLELRVHVAGAVGCTDRGLLTSGVDHPHADLDAAFQAVEPAAHVRTEPARGGRDAVLVVEALAESHR